jgi:ribonuclease-3
MPSNERLEFLGDAVLGFVVADIVYRRDPDLDEGELTDVRKAVVNATALASVAEELDLGRDLLLGKGEAAGGGRNKPSILSDAMEAVLGAVYLDGGIVAVSELVERLFATRIEQAAASLGGLDHKTALQELAARRFDDSPVYRMSEDGPDHAKRFFAEVRIGDEVVGHGQGRTKKQAEQAAAHDAVARLADEAAVGHA